MSTEKDRDENFEALMEFRNQLDSETDRGWSLMAASYLDYELERLLRVKLVGGKKHLDLLFDYSGPLGTFSSKINIAYSLGFISKISLNDLNLIRKIRNDFGHTHHSLNFESENIKSKVNNLKSNYYKPNEIRLRGIFTNTVSGIMAEIHASLILDQKLNEKKSSLISDPIMKKKIKDSAKIIIEKLFEELQNNDIKSVKK